MKYNFSIKTIFHNYLLKVKDRSILHLFLKADEKKC